MSFKPPAYVTGLALEEWKRMLPFMKEKGFDKPEYLIRYTEHCLAVEQLIEAVKDIRERGRFIDGSKDNEVRNPAYVTMREASDRIARCSRAFGFSPEDNKNLKLEEQSEEDIPDYEVDL